MTEPTEWVDRYLRRRTQMGVMLAEMAELSAAYEGAMVLPLPEIDRNERSAVANLIAQDIDQKAMRISSTLPDVTFTSLRPGQDLADRNARISRQAVLGWWTYSKMALKLGRRARWLLGYGTAPVQIRWDPKYECPTWQLWNPLCTFPAPGDDPDELVPTDAIFSYRRSEQWLSTRYPLAMARLSKGAGHNRDSLYDLLECCDAAERTLLVVGKAKDRYDFKGANGLSVVEVLESQPNRIEMPTVVVPGRITLGRRQGAYKNMVGQQYAKAKLFALEQIAVTEGIFPDIYFVGRPGENPQIIDIADGRRGRIGRVRGGAFETLQKNPGYKTDALLDRIEREERVGNSVPAEMGGECVDAETEIFTVGGWKRYDEISVGTEVLTLDHETGMSHWQPILAMNIFPAQRREMVEMEGPRFSALTTTNHRWPVIRRVDHGRAGRGSERVWRVSGDLTSNDRIPKVAICSELPSEPKWSDAMVEAVAWLWTEGTLKPGRDAVARSSGAAIAQSLKHPANLDRIRATLRGVFGPPTPIFPDQGRSHDGVPRWREGSPNRRGIVNFHLSAHASRALEHCAPEKVPTFEFLRSLTLAQLELFIHVSMLADNAGPARFGQADQRRAEAFGFACILSGRAVSYRNRIHYENRAGFRPGPYLIFGVRMLTGIVVKPKENFYRGNSTFRNVFHDGIVWCPTTPDGSWYARRRGSAYYTGNSTTNVRTGKRGDAVLSAAIDFPIQEACRIFEHSLQEENRIAIALAKTVAPNVRKTFDVTWTKTAGRADYTPAKHFTTDANQVTYPHAGADANALLVGLGQRLGIDIMSRRQAMQIDPLQSDPDADADQIVAEKLEAALLAAMLQGAQTGSLDLASIARIAEEFRLGDTTIEEAVAEVNRQKQVEQATSGPPGAPAGPIPPGAPGAQPGLAGPGAPPQAGTIAPTANEQGLAQLLGALKGGAPNPAMVR